MPMSSRTRARSLAVVACLAGAVPVVATSSSATAASPLKATAAASSTDCHYNASKKGGYFTSLKVTKISCSSGKKLVKSHDKCRLKHGAKGTCKSISGYKCSEKRNTSNPVEIDSRVTCTNGSKKFVYTYQQDVA